jgi:DNA-binding NarL/FixJ family response regulator
VNTRVGFRRYAVCRNFGRPVGILGDRDLRQLAGFLSAAGAASTVGADGLVEQIVIELPALLDCGSVMYARFEPSISRTTTVATDPRVAEIREREPEAWWHCLDQHPIVAYRAGSHDGRAVRFSDFLTLRELRRRELYQIFFRPFDAEYVMGVEFCRSPTEFVHVGCTRSSSDFTERDILLLDLLRPHLAHLFRRVGSEEVGIAPLQALGLSHREAEILTYVGRGKSSRAIGRVLVLEPATVRKHIERIYAKLGVHTRAEAAALVLGVWGELPRDWLERDTVAEPLADLATIVLGLTRRETEVVRLLARGLTNAEIATSLRIASGTVKKHLDHIYAKLDAKSRTEAAVRAFTPWPARAA